MLTSQMVRSQSQDLHCFQVLLSQNQERRRLKFTRSKPRTQWQAQKWKLHPAQPRAAQTSQLNFTHFSLRAIQPHSISYRPKLTQLNRIFYSIFYKCQTLLVGMLLALNVCIKVHWLDMGVGRWCRGLRPWILKFNVFLLTFQHNKVVVFVSSGQNEISPLLVPGKDPFGHPGENALFPPSGCNPSDNQVVRSCIARLLRWEVAGLNACHAVLHAISQCVAITACFLVFVH